MSCCCCGCGEYRQRVAANGNFDRMRDDTKSKKKNIGTRSKWECEKCIISHAIGKIVEKSVRKFILVFYLLPIVCILFFIFIFFISIRVQIQVNWIWWFVRNVAKQVSAQGKLFEWLLLSHARSLSVKQWKQQKLIWMEKKIEISWLCPPNGHIVKQTTMSHNNNCNSRCRSIELFKSDYSLGVCVCVCVCVICFIHRFHRRRQRRWRLLPHSNPNASARNTI